MTSTGRSHESRWQPATPVADTSTSDVVPSAGKRSMKETAASVNQKTEELTDWIAGRLQDHAWNASNKEVFRGKLASYQSVQINGHEKNLADVLVKDAGTTARQRLPDDLKKDLVASVQQFLKNNDDVLRYFKRSRQSPSS